MMCHYINNACFCKISREAWVKNRNVSTANRRVLIGRINSNENAVRELSAG